MVVVVSRIVLVVGAILEVVLKSLVVIQVLDIRISELVVILVVEVSAVVVLVVVVIIVVILEIVVVNKSVVDVDWVKSKDEIARLVLVFDEALEVVVLGAPIFILI